MTQDELLKLIKRKDDGCRGVGALLAVVELHKPMIWKNLGNDTDGYMCEVCEGNSYPCPTIQAIEKELN